MIELADHADAAGARRPNRKIHAANAFECLDVRAQFVVSIVVAPFTHKIQIELADEQGKGVSVVALEGVAGSGAIHKAIAGWRGTLCLGLWQLRFKKAFATNLLCFDDARGIGELDADAGDTGV